MYSTNHVITRMPPNKIATCDIPPAQIKNAATGAGIKLRLTEGNTKLEALNREAIPQRGLDSLVLSS